MPVVRVSAEIFARLQSHARPLVDGVNDVLARILTHYEETAKNTSLEKPPNVQTSFKTLKTTDGSLWKCLVSEFNKLDPKFRATEGGTAYYKQIKCKHRDIHYEWALRKSKSSLDVCLHFESPDRETNL